MSEQSPLSDARLGCRRPLSVAPMMDRTDRHFRYLCRLMSREVLLYTEMVTTGAILYGDKGRHLDFNQGEGPLVLQLGGDDPGALAECAAIAEQWGYDGVNLNVGCPSDRVQKGSFGAALMRYPERVAAGVRAMRDATQLPVTVKHRIGVDELDRYEDMARFVEIVSESGCDGFTVHARKAWLQGLSPKENRTIPPLRYEEVYRLKAEAPERFIEINGGLRDWPSIEAQLAHVDAVMVGRGFYEEPRLLLEADQRLFGSESAPPQLSEVVEAMAAYTDRHIAAGGRAHHVTRHLVHLLRRRPGNQHWRRHLSVEGVRAGATGDVVREAWGGAEEIAAGVAARRGLA